MNIREMIRKSIEDSERWRGGLGIGAAEKAARPTTPDRAYRPVDNTEQQARGNAWIDEERCRIVGFLPLPRKAV